MGARCHLPTAKVEYPAPRSISARVAARLLMRPVQPGKPVSQLLTTAMPTEWWLRPVSRHARVGEQMEVVWKLL